MSETKEKLNASVEMKHAHNNTPLVLYQYKTLTLILRKDHRLQAHENKFFRKISGSKTDDV